MKKQLLGFFCVAVATVFAGEQLELVTGNEFGPHVAVASNPADGNGLALEGTILYTGAGDTVRAYETSGNPLHPRLLGEIRIGGGVRVRQLAVRNGIVGITARESQVMFLDFRNPSQPVFCSRFDCLELATGIDFGGNVCFVGQRCYGVEFIDVSDPYHPAHIDYRKTDESQSVVYRNGYCYSGEWGSAYVTVFDCHDMANVTQTDKQELHGFGDGVWLKGDYLFCATGHHSRHRPTKGLRSYYSEDVARYSPKGTRQDDIGAGHGMDVFSVADPAHPRHLGRVDFPPIHSRDFMDAWTVRADGVRDVVYCAQTINGIFAVDVSDPAKPKVIDRFCLPNRVKPQFPSTVMAALAVGDGVVYVAASGYGIVAVPVKGARRQQFDRGMSPANPGSRRQYANDDALFHRWQPSERGQVRGVVVHGSVAYVACGDAGLHIVDVLPTGGFGSSRRVPGVKQAFDVSLRGNRVVVAEGAAGWAFYEIAGDRGLHEFARLPCPDRLNCAFWAWYVAENRVILAPRNSAYRIAMVDGKTVRLAKGRMRVNAPGWDKYMGDELFDGRWIPYNMGCTAIAWADISNPDDPKVTISNPLDRSNQNCSVCRFGEFALFSFTDFRNGYKLLRPGETKGELLPFPDGGRGGCVRTDGRYAIFTQRYNRAMWFYDMSDPLKPRLEWKATTLAHPDTAFVRDGIAFIPCGYQGLLMSKPRKTAK